MADIIKMLLSQKEKPLNFFRSFVFPGLYCASVFINKTVCRIVKTHEYFFHPDFTVGTGITPDRPVTARGLYRR